MSKSLCLFILVASAAVLTSGYPSLNSSEEDEEAGCWPELTQNVLELRVMIQEIAKIFADAGDTIPGEFVFKFIVCQLEKVDSVSDLIALIPTADKEVIRLQYTMTQMAWRAVEGMKGVREIAEAVNAELQVLIDINFPYEIPVTSMTTKEIYERLTDPLKGYPGIIANLIILGSRMGYNPIKQTSDALVDSPNFEAFADAMEIDPTTIEAFYMLHDAAPIFQKMLPLMVDSLDQLQLHGFFELV